MVKRSHSSPRGEGEETVARTNTNLWMVAVVSGSGAPGGGGGGGGDGGDGGGGDGGGGRGGDDRGKMLRMMRVTAPAQIHIL